MTESSDKDTSQAMIMAHASVSRLAAQSAVCKLWGMILGVLILVVMMGRPGGDVFLWGLLPLILLVIADGCYFGKAVQLSTAVTKESTALQILKAHQSDGAGHSFRTLSGILSLSVWPFYLCLGGAIVALGLTVLKSPTIHLPGGLHSTTVPGMPTAGAVNANPFGGPPGVNSTPAFPGANGPSQITGGNPFGGRGSQVPMGANRPALPPGGVQPGAAMTFPRQVPGQASGPGIRPQSVPPGILNRPSSSQPNPPPGNATPGSVQPPTAVTAPSDGAKKPDNPAQPPTR